MGLMQGSDRSSLAADIFDWDVSEVGSVPGVRFYQFPRGFLMVEFLKLRRLYRSPRSSATAESFKDWCVALFETGVIRAPSCRGAEGGSIDEAVGRSAAGPKAAKRARALP